MNQLMTPRQAKKRWESLCRTEGGCQAACCHFGGSPCTELTPELTCRIYAERFGMRETVDGQAFQCVPMHIMLKYKPAPDLCGYKVIRSVSGVPVVQGQA